MKFVILYTFETVIDLIVGSTVDTVFGGAIGSMAGSFVSEKFIDED